jgi:hypothetical protein
MLASLQTETNREGLPSLSSATHPAQRFQKIKTTKKGFVLLQLPQELLHERVGLQSDSPAGIILCCRAATPLRAASFFDDGRWRGLWNRCCL